MNLTVEQQAVVDLREGHHLVAAGPGSGKTRMLVERCRALLTDGVPGHQILAISFTKGAALELQARLVDVPGGPDVKCSTWHAWGFRLLREAQVAKDLCKYPVSVLRAIFAEQHQQEVQPNGGEGFTPELMAKRITQRKIAGYDTPSSHWPREWCEVMRAYQARLVECRQVDFADMLLRAWQLLRSDPELLAQCHRRHVHVQVDECFDGLTPILMTDGNQIAIRDLVEQKLPGPVLSMDQAGRMVPSRVVGWHKRLATKPMVRVRVCRAASTALAARKVKYGIKFLVCTEDHKIWTPGGWTRAGELAVGGSVYVESSVPRTTKQEPFYNHVKHGLAGRARLGQLIQQRNAAGTCGYVRSAGYIPKRGGNGTPVAPAQQLAFTKLSAVSCLAWELEHTVAIGDGQLPYKYSIDIANPQTKIGAEVLSVDKWTPREAYVYDLTVEGTHTYVADGVIVHNCQDNNVLQWRLAELLGQGTWSLVVVGDLCQSIFAFAGAVPKDMVRFAKAATLHSVTRNFRSTKPVVLACNRLMQHADKAQLLGKPFCALDEAVGPDPTYNAYPTSGAEAVAVAGEIAQAISEGVAPRQLSVLYRTRRCSARVSAALLARGVPHIIRGGQTLWDLPHVRVLLDYLRAVAAIGAPGDVLPKILHLPKRYLGRDFAGAAAGVGWDVGSINDLVRTQPCNKPGVWRLRWQALLDDLVALRAPGLDTEALIRRILELESYGRNRHTLRQQLEGGSLEGDGEGTLDEDWATVLGFARGYAEPREFLLEVERMRGAATADEEDEPDAVVLQTIHRAKGTEYERVWVIQVNEGVLPHLLAVQADQEAMTHDNVEEERRILFVAMSRAARRLSVSWSDKDDLGRTRPPSRFLAEVM